MAPSIFVTQLDLKLANKLRADLIEQEFELAEPPHTLFSAKKKGVSCTLYQSGKLVVQGKEMAAFLEFYLEPEILKSFQFTYQADEKIDATARIGIDESGKGDFFGPLCIAGVFAEGEQIAHLKKIGVKDSKELSDAQIRKIAMEIQKAYVHQIVKINPAKYNELYEQFKNLNHMLAWGHATAIENLAMRTGCKNVIIDQFAHEWVVETALKRKHLGNVALNQRHRGEEDLVVAAASILARYAFIDGLEKLGKEFGCIFPKGASAKTVAAARAFVQKHGQEALSKVCKLHFKTTSQIL